MDEELLCVSCFEEREHEDIDTCDSCRSFCPTDEHLIKTCDGCKEAIESYLARKVTS